MPNYGNFKHLALFESLKSRYGEEIAQNGGDPLKNTEALGSRITVEESNLSDLINSINHMQSKYALDHRSSSSISENA